ncbi:helix-turn-helix transcriptional regulator [Paractinoplanes hotanensis]|uniref:AAA family ATPase n=1 Tax=Paractinoplanes hotanensis TaxID=2906497 RepID=A0ABT0Y525_9ACTN|nr:LuxR family transcriptional regulator [Actinoplanes hotanensis]MCM4080930.1 AAA family ATPase [Actinoplanes hotanensis]
MNRDPHSYPLRGRDSEIAVLSERLDALAGGRGSTVVVTGAPGTGKSRLLHEAERLSRRYGLRVLRVAGEPDAAVMPGDGLLRGMLAGSEPVLDADRARALATRPDHRYWLLQEVEEGLEQLASRRPVLMLVDDLQWCDDLTMMGLRALPGRMSGVAVAWLFAGRSGDDTAGYTETRARLAADGATTVVLDRLADDAAAQMVRDVLGEAASAEALALAGEADNNPLLISELMTGIREAGRADLPARLGGLVARRLARLSADARAVLEVAAVMSRRLDVPFLAAVLHRGPATLVAPLREAQVEDLVQADGGDLVFRHDLIREAIRMTVPAAVARAIRREAADLATGFGHSPAEVAALLADSAEPGDGEAISTLRRAAAELAAGAPSRAADLSRRALTLTADHTPAHREITVETIRLLWLAGRSADATALGHTLLADGVDSATEAVARLGIAAASSQYSFAEAVRQCELAVGVAGLPPAGRAQALALMGVNLTMVGDFARADEVLGRAMAAAVEAGDDGARALCVASSSVSAMYHHRWQQAMDLADEAVAISRTVRSDQIMWGAVQWRSWLDSLSGRPNLALRSAVEGTRVAQRDGQAWLVRQWSLDRCRLLYDAGRLADARAEAEGVLAMADELGAGNYADCTALMTAARVALHTGDLATADRYDAEAERMRTDRAPLVRRAGLWLSVLVAVAHRRGPGRIRELLAKGAVAMGSVGPALGSPADPADDVAFVRIARAIGEEAWAERAVVVAEDRAAANPGFPFLTATARHARGLLTGDAGAVAEAIAVYRQYARPLPLSAALEDAAALAAGTAAPEEARRLLEEALSIYEETGALRDAARVRGALRKVGVRWRGRRAPSRPGDRWSQLTATELMVVEKVAGGATNRQVANAMFLSPHTVNTHLRHAFTKLEVNSRLELARLFAQRTNAV